MGSVLDGSRIVGACRRAGERVRKTAGESILCRPKWERDVFAHSGLVSRLGRLHPGQHLVNAVAGSRIFGWLYSYWSALCGAYTRGLALLFAPFALTMALRMALAGRYLMTAGLLFFTAFCMLLPAGVRLRDWMLSSLPGRLWTRAGQEVPPGAHNRSVYLYWLICGLLGGAAGWSSGVGLGLAVTLAGALAPLLFAVPPVWAAGLLCLLLPVCGTSVCWALSIYTAVSYLFARAFGGLSGKPLDYADILLLLFPLFCGVSAAFSFNRADSVKVFAMWVGLFFCVFFIKRSIRSRRQLAGTLGALAAGAAISGLVGIAQYLSGTVDTTWTDTALFEDIALRVYSTFENPNVYGEYLLLMMPLVMALLLYVKKGWQKLLLGALEVLLLVNMALTYSRGCYVGLALTAVVFLWNCSKKWLGAICVLGVPLAVLLMPESVVMRILSIGNMSDTSTSYRIQIYIGTLMMLAVYWLGGVGLGEGAFNAVYPAFALTAIAAPHPHSLFFELVVAFGIVGLLYFLLVLAVYRRNLKKEQQGLSRRSRLLLVGFAAVMWGFVLQSIFDYTWYNYRVFQLFWIVVALGIAAPAALKEPAHD